MIKLTFNTIISFLSLFNYPPRNYYYSSCQFKKMKKNKNNKKSFQKNERKRMGYQNRKSTGTRLGWYLSSKIKINPSIYQPCISILSFLYSTAILM